MPAQPRAGSNDRLPPLRLAGAVRANENEKLAEAVLEKLAEDHLTVQLDIGNIDRLTVELDKSSNRIAIGMVMGSLVLASALLIRSVPDSQWFAIPIFLLSSLLWLWLIYGIFRSGSV